MSTWKSIVQLPRLQDDLSPLMCFATVVAYLGTFGPVIVYLSYRWGMAYLPDSFCHWFARSLGL
jgi:hypothetical protein